MTSRAPSRVGCEVGPAGASTPPMHRGMPVVSSRAPCVAHRAHAVPIRIHTPVSVSSSGPRGGLHPTHTPMGPAGSNRSPCITHLINVVTHRTRRATLPIVSVTSWVPRGKSCPPLHRWTPCVANRTHCVTARAPCGHTAEPVCRLRGGSRAGAPAHFCTEGHRLFQFGPQLSQRAPKLSQFQSMLEHHGPIVAVTTWFPRGCSRPQLHRGTRCVATRTQVVTILALFCLTEDPSRRLRLGSRVGAPAHLCTEGPQWFQVGPPL